MSDRILFLIAPSRVRSRTDGDMHRPSAPALAHLYGLRPGEWREFDPVTDRHSDLPVLGPRYDGDYSREAALRLLDGGSDE